MYCTINQDERNKFKIYIETEFVVNEGNSLDTYDWLIVV